MIEFKAKDQVQRELNSICKKYGLGEMIAFLLTPDERVLMIDSSTNHFKLCAAIGALKKIYANL
jgi:hypothetical protein